MNSAGPKEEQPVYEALPDKVTALQWGLIFLLMLSALINYVDRQSTNVISPLLIQQFRLSDEQWGWVNAVFALTYIGTAALGGIWIDRVGVRRGLLISTGFWSLAAAGHALARGFGELCFWRALLAVGEGPGGAALLKGVRTVLPLRLQDTGTSLVGAGTLLGALLAPIVVAPLADRLGWQAAFIVTAALGALWIPFWAWMAARGSAHLASEPVPTAPDHRGRLDFRSPAVWATGVAIFFTVPPTVFTLSFLARYLSVTFGLPVKQLALLQWQPFLAADLGQLTGGAVLFMLLRARWSFLSARRLVMFLGFSGSTLMALMTVAPSLGWAMFWLNLARYCFQFAYVALLAYGISCVPVEQAGRMNGFMNATFGACNFVFNPLLGRLADLYHHDYRPVLLLVSLCPLVGLASWAVLSARVRFRQPPQAGK